VAEMPDNFNVTVSEIRDWARKLVKQSEGLDGDVETDVSKFKFYKTCSLLLFTFADKIEESADEDEDEDDVEVTLTVDKKLN